MHRIRALVTVLVACASSSSWFVASTASAGARRSLAQSVSAEAPSASVSVSSSSAFAFVMPGARDDIVFNANATGGLCVVLHGLGDTGDGWADVAEDMAGTFKNVRFVLPTAPLRRVTLNMGMRMPAWYDIRSLDALEGRDDDVGMEESRATVEAIVSKAKADGVPENKIVLMGFSQGGAVALYVALKHAGRLAGVVGLSTYLPLHTRFPAEQAAQSRDLPTLLCHGDADQVVRYAWGTATRDKLKALGLDTTMLTYPGMGHGAVPREIEDVRQFLAKRFSD